DRLAALPDHAAVAVAADALAGRGGRAAARDPRKARGLAALRRDRLRAVLRAAFVRGGQRAVVAGRWFVPVHGDRGDAVRAAALPRPATADPGRRVRHRPGDPGRRVPDAARTRAR